MADDELWDAAVEASDPALRRLLWLRFPTRLEDAFRSDYETTSTISRAIVQILGIVLIAITPLYDDSVLHAPPAYLHISHDLEFGVQIPIALAALICTATPILRPVSRLMTVVGMIIIALCLSTLHLIGRPMGFHVPIDFSAITVVAVLFAGRLRVIEITPWAVLTLAATSWNVLRSSDDSATLYSVISTWMLFVIAFIGAWFLEFTARQNWYHDRRLRTLASRDALTGLPNRRYFDHELRLLLRAAQHEHRSVSLLLLDIDFFKAFNDHYGHPLGDDCLRRIGTCLTQSMRRPRDFAARIGGEEFAAVWFDADVPSASRMAEQLRLSVDALAIPPAPGCGEIVTASGGFAQILPSAGVDVEKLVSALITAADGALYEAKRSGRGRLIRASALIRAAA